MPVLTLPAAERPIPTARAKALVFEDPRSRQLLEDIRRVAPSDATVLITGETGTGKEIVARHLHELSRRAAASFVAVNCGALPEQLVESELFGHERGAFTGALASRVGWFEAAHRGTLFLDEIGDLPLPLQVKLLRVLQEQEVVRLGSRTAVPIDVRLVAATNVNLEEAMAAGHFREDLFYRLNVTELRLPPLRERPGDVVPLAQHFLDSFVRKLGMEPITLSPAAERRLVEHAWPGNIRELENVVHHALLVCQGHEIGAEDLRLGVTRRARSAPPPPEPRPDPFAALEEALRPLFEAAPPQLFERIEAVVMRAAYRHSNKNQLATARLLDVSRNVVRARLLECGELEGSLRGNRPSVAPPATPRPPDAPAARGLRVVPAPPGNERFRIGYHKFSVLAVVKALGAFDAMLASRGVRVEWYEFPSGPEVAQALESGDVSLGVMGDCPSVLAQARRAPFVYVAAEAPAPEAEAIVVHEDSDIRSVSDLAGRTVAVKRGSNAHYLLLCALEEARVALDGVQLRFSVPEKARSAFECRHVDAWAIWDPHLTNVQLGGRARVLRDGQGLALNSAYYLAERDFADQNPELIDELVAHAQKAVAWARTNTDLVAELVSAQLHIAPHAIASWLRRHPTTRPVTAEQLASQQQVADTLHRFRLIPEALNVADVQWRRLAG